MGRFGSGDFSFSRPDLAARLDESFLEFWHRQRDGGGAGGEQDVTSRGDKLLIVSKHLAQAAFGAIAEDGVADGSGRSDDAEPGENRRRRVGRVPLQKPHRECAAIQPATVFTHSAKVALTPQVLLRAKTHGEGK